NRAAHALLVRAPDVPVVVHDWWLYLLVTGCGGRVRYDPEPAIDYRQHGGNQIGSAAGLSERLGRLRAALRGRIAQWNEVNDRALARVEPMLSAEARRVLAAFRAARRGGVVSRLRHLADSGVWRQTAAGTLSLWAGALANRL
ncbi:MAG: glycosyltransferase family 2 protein, partial [Burkholderiaceae bacterium]